MPAVRFKAGVSVEQSTYLVGEAACFSDEVVAKLLAAGVAVPCEAPVAPQPEQPAPMHKPRK